MYKFLALVFLTCFVGSVMILNKQKTELVIQQQELAEQLNIERKSHETAEANLKAMTCLVSIMTKVMQNDKQTLRELDTSCRLWRSTDELSQCISYNIKQFCSFP